MEHLEQYRVVVDYERMDNHQVDLTVGQIVHVIEKHDTGTITADRIILHTSFESFIEITFDPIKFPTSVQQ